MNGKNVAVQPMVLHAMGLLYSFLPTKEFVYKMFDEMVVLIQTDPHLGEFSQPCNIVRYQNWKLYYSYFNYLLAFQM